MLKSVNSKLINLIVENISFHYIRGGVTALSKPYGKNWKIRPENLFSQVCNGSVVNYFKHNNKRFIGNDLETFFLRAGTVRRIEFLTPPPITFKWSHVHFSIFQNIDFLTFFDIPVVIKGAPGKELGAINEQYSNLTDDHFNCHNISSLATIKKLGFRQLEIIISISNMSPNTNNFLNEFHRYKDLFDYIETNFRKKICVAYLAKQANLSASRFHRIFKQITGISPMDFVNKRRYKEAEKLLLTESKSIACISEILGYQDQFTFSRSFKKHCGLSPKQFRQTVLLENYE